MTSITILAPAKVNLFLKVLNKRKDGYHNILTLFERISLADKIKISKIPQGIAVSSDKFITRDPKDNLAYKAAKLILNCKKIKSGVKIDIKKRIPIAAGLGGGSSDGASALIGVNKLFNLRLKKTELVRLAKKLGADAPFFILNAPFAIGRARGDELKEIALKIRPWHLIVYPGNLKVSTRDIYKEFDRLPKRLILRQAQGQVLSLSKDLTNKAADAKISLSLRHSMDLGELESMLYNDLQDTVIAKKEAIGKLIRRLASSLGKVAIISGSGPSLFCLCRTRKEAMRAKKKLLDSAPAAECKGWRIFIAGTED